MISLADIGMVSRDRLLRELYLCHHHECWTAYLDASKGRLVLVVIDCALHVSTHYLTVEEALALPEKWSPWYEDIHWDVLLSDPIYTRLPKGPSRVRSFAWRRAHRESLSATYGLSKLAHGVLRVARTKAELVALIFKGELRGDVGQEIVEISRGEEPIKELRKLAMDAIPALEIGADDEENDIRPTER